MGIEGGLVGPGHMVGGTVVGIDVGGTLIKAALIDPADPATVLARVELPAPPAGADAGAAVLAGCHRLTDRLRQEASRRGRRQPAAVGVAVPGIVDEPAGVAVFSAAYGWRDQPVREQLAGLVGLPVAFGHDVRTAGLAEWRLGAGRGVDDLLVVSLGTGIGAALVVDGRLCSAGGYAGQLGHVVIDPNGPECGCGQRGCVGVLASASAIERRYRQVSGRERVDGAREVARLAAAGDPTAARVWDAALTDLTTMLVQAVTLLGPTRLVLAGGPSAAGPLLSEPVAGKLAAALRFQRRPDVVTARLGADAGILGAGLAAARLGRDVDDV
jgi:glucokinase